MSDKTHILSDLAGTLEQFFSTEGGYHALSLSSKPSPPPEDYVSIYCRNGDWYWQTSAGEEHCITCSGSTSVTLTGTGGINTTLSGNVWYIDGSEIEGTATGTASGIVHGESTFNSINGRTITHNLGTTDHFTVVMPEGLHDFNRRDIASIGGVFVKLGADQDIVYNTGGPRSVGVKFYWQSTLSGVLFGQTTASGAASEEWVQNLVTTTSGDIINQIPVISTDGNVTGSGTFSIAGTTIVHNLGTSDHYVSVTPAGTANYVRRDIAALGEIYVEKGSNSDVVYKTGGPRSDGIAFDWEVMLPELTRVEVA